MSIDVLRSLRFVSAMNFGPAPAVDVSTIELGAARIRADVYRPRRRRSRGVILSVHGMTLLGRRDPRITKLCTMLTLSGHTIVSPQFEEIADLRIDLATLDHLVDALRAVANDPDLRPPSGRIGILAHSFAAAMAIAAVARPEAAQLVNVVCAMGGAYNFEVTIESLLGRQDPNPYPRRVLLWNFLQYSIGQRPGLERALRTALEDDGYHREQRQLPKVLESLDPEDRDLFVRLQDEPEFRLMHFQRFRPMLAPLTAAIDGIEHVRVPIILIHGENDTVVPASQSRSLYERLQRDQVPAMLEISPLLDHKGPALRLGMIAPAGRMIRTLAAFFRLAAS